MARLSIHIQTVVWAIVVGLGIACDGDTDPADAEAVTKPARVLLVSLHGFVGCGVDADLIRQSIAEQLARVNDPVDAVVFSIDTGGGMLNRVGPLSDLIHERVSERVRCLGWIERAESAGALVALNIPELWMPIDGTIGAVIGVRRDPSGEDGWVPLAVADQQAVRYVAAACAARGGHDQALALRLTGKDSSESGSSDEASSVLTGDEAERLGLVRVAPSLESMLDRAFGPRGWVIDFDASESISEAIAAAEAVRERVIELQARYQIAVGLAEKRSPDAIGIAEGYLDEIHAISVRGDPPAMRATVFLSLFEWIDAAKDRMDGLSGETGP